MELLGPALFGVKAAEIYHQKGCEFPFIDWIGGVTFACRIVNCGGFIFRTEIGVAMFQTVVAQAAALAVKEIVPLLYRDEEPGESGTVDTAHFFQFVCPGVKYFRRIDGQRLVGTKGGINFCGQVALGDFFVVIEGVGGIVSRADHRHPELFEDAMRRKLGRLQFFVCGLPDSLGSVLAQKFIDVEITLQLEVAPMVNRTAQGMRYGARPCHKLLLR